MRHENKYIKNAFFTTCLDWDQTSDNKPGRCEDGELWSVGEDDVQ